MGEVTMQIIKSFKSTKQPTKQVVNQLNQTVDFYTPDDELDYVIGVIDGVAFETDFHDADDFYKDSDYNPIMLDNNTIVCHFAL